MMELIALATIPALLAWLYIADRRYQWKRAVKKLIDAEEYVRHIKRD